MNAREAHQMELERLYNKNQLMSRVCNEFIDCKEFNFIAHMEKHGIPPKFGISLLAQMSLHKRADLRTLLGTLRHHCDTAQEVADLILKCAEVDLVDYNYPMRMFIVRFNISDDVQAELDRFQYPLPMVVKPRVVRTNKQHGMLTGSGSIILRNNYHEDDVCLDHINRLNSIRLTINNDTANMVQNKWRHLDKPKAGESKADFQRRKKAFEKYDTAARDVIALLNQEGNDFYLTHKYDKRGRTYCQGYHVTYQGAPWNKAVIELADKEIIE